MTQREIRFLIWDADKKRMSEPIGVYHPVIKWTDGDIDMPTQFAIAKDSRFFFRQWTGLKDKNGRDIYEGDILKFFDKIVATVVWKDFGGWSYNWIDKTYKTIRQQNPEPFFHNINLWEVVGNIYSDPELLES